MLAPYEMRKPTGTSGLREGQMRKMAAPPNNTLREAALSYAASGLPVFPLRPGLKTPATKNGFKDATTDTEQIKAWWSEGPAYNIGIPTGQVTGRTVLDPDGPHAPPLLKRDGLNPPESAVVRTPNGHHLCLTYDPALKQGARLLKADCDCVDPATKRPKPCGVDVRNDGGYVTAPPSIVGGKTYKWLREGDLLPWPEITEYITKRQPDRDSRANNPDPGQIIAEGEREATIMRSLGALRRVGAGESELRATAEAMNDRCDPPLGGRDIERMVKSAMRYSPAQPMKSTEDVSHDSEPLRFIWRTAHELVETEPEAVPWVVRGYVARGAVTELAAPIKAGKTTFTLSMVKAMLAGEIFAGEPVERCESLVYLTEENRGVYTAGLRRAGIDSDRLHVLHQPENRGIAWAEVMAEATRMALTVGSAGIVVDTRSSWAGLAGDSENDSGSALAAMQAVTAAASQGLFVLVIVHDRKSGGELGQSARGSSAFGGSADILVHLVKATTPGNENRREVQRIGRFDDIEPRVFVEYRDNRYVNLGDSAQIERREARAALLEVVPDGEDNAVRRSDITDRIEKAFTGQFSKSSVDRAINDLMEEKILNRKRKGNGYLIWIENPRLSVIETTPEKPTQKAVSQPPVPLKNDSSSTSQSSEDVNSRLSGSIPIAEKHADDIEEDLPWPTNGHDTTEPFDPAKVKAWDEVELDF